MLKQYSQFEELKLTVEVCKEKLVEMDEEKGKLIEDYNAKLTKMKQQMNSLSKSNEEL